MDIIHNDKRRVLLVGFPIPASEFIENHTLLSQNYDVLEFAHPLECLDFLGTFGADEVFSIIVDLPTLKNDNFRFLQVLHSNKNLLNIPVIGVAPGWTQLNREVLIKKGLDDCYVEPVDWIKLEKRVSFIHFLNKHNKSEVTTVPVTYKIPIWKRGFDILFSGTILLILSPFLALVALAIRLESKGKVFYTSKRAGTGYKVFDFIKFRSMIPDADQKIKDLAHLNNYSDTGKKDKAVFVKLKNDPRITRVGKIIRKTSIDELPQLINVLKGDMSVVGNRPLPLYEAEMLTKDAWAARFIAPAGLTGLWQVAKGGKVNVSNEQRISLDIEYAEKSSFLTDLKILARTLPAMIQKGE